MPTTQNTRPDEAITALGFPIRLLTVAALLTILVFAWLGWNIFAARRDATLFTDRLSRIEELRGVIVHLDEVLTMSARLAAATGDGQWEERYRRYEPQLDTAIKATMELEPAAFIKRNTSATDAANLKLVALENRAFALARLGRKEEAQAVLASPEYDTQKKIYATGITAVVNAVRQEIDDRQRANLRMGWLSLSAALVVGGISFGTWLFAFRGGNHWRVALEGAVSERAQAERALRRANDELEIRVAERTASLKNEIDGRELAQTALQKSLERHEYVARASHDVLWDWDLKTNLVHWGEGLQTQLGYAPAAIHSTLAWWEQRLQPDDRARALAQLHAALKKNAPLWDGEYRFQRGDGSYAMMLDRACILYDAAGQPTRLVGAMADITDRKRAEAELAQAARELLVFSRQAGMAEVATSVLHNVGNVLNSVSVAAEVMAGKVRQLRSGSLQSVALLLREHARDLPAFLTQDPRGRALPDYLLQLVGHLSEPQAGILQELEDLRKNLGHIKEIVAMQQRYARGSTVWETVALPELVEDALPINAAGFGRHDVLVIREFSPVPPVVTDRHQVLQILVNLVNNAKYALAKTTGDKRLRVRVTAHGTAGVSIAVRDNGVGIAPENLSRIFQHGFTTKPDGHGFGLHSGALAAKELGGRLTAHSDGVGQGAVFTRELPLQNPHARP